MQNIPITGGAGFIGANFILYFLKENIAYNVVNIDARN
jgi:dTDP-glucose 4,6-dehydratase